MVATGAQTYDHWFDWQPTMSRVSTSAPWSAWTRSGPTCCSWVPPRPSRRLQERDFVLKLGPGAARARRARNCAMPGLLIRPHPQNGRSVGSRPIRPRPRQRGDLAARRRGPSDAPAPRPSTTTPSTTRRRRGRHQHERPDRERDHRPPRAHHPRRRLRGDAGWHVALRAHRRRRDGPRARRARASTSTSRQLDAAIATAGQSDARYAGTFVRRFVRPHGLGQRATLAASWTRWRELQPGQGQPLPSPRLGGPRAGRC